MNFDRLVAHRAASVNASGIRRVFELGRSLKDPINLSIGQPDFPVPDAIKNAAIDAIREDRNGYTLTQGIPELQTRIKDHLAHDLGWDFSDSAANPMDAIVTSGTSGALFLLAMATLQAGDEIIVPDPYFVIYPHLAGLFGAKPVICSTYPDFRLTAERVEPLITERTKFVLLNSPSNPCGVVADKKTCTDLLELCRSRGVLLVSDEIYDEFTFSDGLTDPTPDGTDMRCPSPSRNSGGNTNGQDTLVIRGFGKTYGCTGWRLGYAAGPKPLMMQMAKMQQYSFVCAPSMGQWGALKAFDVDMHDTVSAYQKKRDMVLDALGDVTEISKPGGAFYAFIKVPERLGMTASQLFEKAIEKNLLMIPGNVFSTCDTHFRISFATSNENLARGLDVLRDLMKG
ncbi:MAG: aminotransferase class I/II-fold pyridoxal phosphate-dependent enzyme [Phycisphaeraceae bacterium]|nr:aminotransferase class I/II-fold pyridoxal phosphate-dependent enzyme [Phycisphaeraceae bacterium]